MHLTERAGDPYCYYVYALVEGQYGDQFDRLYRNKDNTVESNYLDQKTGKGPFCFNPKADAPNIVLVTMDMVPPEFHTGELQMMTPNQLLLAAEGVNFTRTFSASPLCGPSRAALLTGRYAYITGNSERSHDGHTTILRNEDIIWPEYLKARGYHCRHVGKSHIGTEHFIRAFSENASPWNRWSPPWYDEDAYIDFLRRMGLERFSFKKEIRGMSWTGERDGNSYGGWLADQNGRPFPEEALYPAFLTDKAIRTIEARRNSEQPFYLQLDYFGPHQPFAIPGGLEEREAEIRTSLELPESWLVWEAAGFPEACDDPRVYDLYRRNWGMRNRDDMLDYLTANRLQYELLDRQLGRLMEYLKKEKLYDNSMIIFTADHGEMNGRKGCIDKGAYLNPQVLHVPLYLKPAKNQTLKQGLKIDTPCSLLDICPTVCEAAGIGLFERIDGVSLFDTAKDMARPVERPVMFDVWNHVMPNPCVGRILEAEGRQLLYSYNAVDPRDELYDLDKTGDLQNLIPEGDALGTAARTLMHTALKADPRWDIYLGYFELEYAERLEMAPTDNQKFE
jgi:arylsulfatase A-like enzyme